MEQALPLLLTLGNFNVGEVFVWLDSQLVVVGRFLSTYYGWITLGFIGCLMFNWWVPKALEKLTGKEKLFVAISLSIPLGPIILLAFFSYVTLRFIWNRATKA